MTPAEAAVLLGMAATVDNRKPDADAAKAWAAMLDGIRFEDACAAIVAHYRDDTTWLMPSMIRAGVKRIRRDRMLAFGPLPEPPAEIGGDPASYGAWLSDTTRAIADGELTQENYTPAEPPRLTAPERMAELRELLAAGRSMDDA